MRNWLKEKKETDLCRQMLEVKRSINEERLIGATARLKREIDGLQS